MIDRILVKIESIDDIIEVEPACEVDNKIINRVINEYSPVDQRHGCTYNRDCFYKKMTGEYTNLCMYKNYDGKE